MTECAGPWKIPSHWRWSSMGLETDVIGGGTPSTKDASNYDNGEIPWITPADLSGYTEKFISHGRRNITEQGLKGSGARMMPAGTVLFSSRAPIGYVAIARNPVSTNQGFKSFVPNGTITPDYLYYYLQRARDLAVALSSGTTFPEISGKRAREIPVPVPPLDEQSQIVAEIETQLARLDDAVASLQRARTRLKRYRALVLKTACEGRLVPTEAELARQEGREYEPASVLLDRIKSEQQASANGKHGRSKKSASLDPSDLTDLPEGWAWTKWEDLAGRVTVGHVGPMKNEYVASGIPFLRSQNVRENRFDPAGLLFITPEFHVKLSKSRIFPGDLAVVRSGSVGVTCVIPESLGEANCADLVLIQRPEGIVPQYGAYYMNSLAKRLIRQGQVGVALIHFNTKSVAALPVPIPPLAEQKRIVAEVERRLSILDQLESSVDTNLKRAEALRQSILRAAFSGRLVGGIQPVEMAQ